MSVDSFLNKSSNITETQYRLHKYVHRLSILLQAVPVCILYYYKKFYYIVYIAMAKIIYKKFQIFQDHNIQRNWLHIHTRKLHMIHIP